MQAVTQQHVTIDRLPKPPEKKPLRRNHLRPIQPRRSPPIHRETRTRPTTHPLAPKHLAPPIPTSFPPEACLEKTRRLSAATPEGEHTSDYNRQGEPIEKKDQNGTVHAFSYDALGRLTEDEVTAFGDSVDDRVIAIARTYEVRGMPETITSYGDASASSSSSSGTGRVVLNQVHLQYDDLGRLVKDFQEHEGAKDDDTLYTEYNYPDFATSALRLESFRYPNGRKTHFDYSSTHGTALNRLDAIKDDDSGSPGATLAQYTWLGLGTMVVEDFTEPQVKLDYFGGATGTYAGFDRFGRVIDQKWYDYGVSAIRDQYTYGHDRVGNRLYRENTGPSGKDEYYTYDGINRLVNFDRGDLNANKDAISGTPAREQDFTLDATGNWKDFVIKTSGSTDLNQSRTHNKVNELTDVTETQGAAWLTPAHDKAGNMTTVPKPSDLANALTCTYDAWNRLVEVEDAAAEVTVARYEYDGIGRRIKKHLDSQSPADPDGIDTYDHHYYLGVRLIETRETGTETAEPEDLQPQYQHVWSPRYVDAPILRDENTDADSLCDDERIYYLTDANMNVTSLVDTTGDALERYLYDPYGNVTIYDGVSTNTRTTSNYSNTLLFTGRELDAETGLHYYRARYYSAEAGRFLGRDPIGYGSGDESLYRYVMNRPLFYVDPNGLEVFSGWDHWDLQGWLRIGDTLITGKRKDEKGQYKTCWGDDSSIRPRTKREFKDKFRMVFQFEFLSDAHKQGRYTAANKEKGIEKGDPIPDRPGFVANSGVYIYNSVEVAIMNTRAILKEVGIEIDEHGMLTKTGWREDAIGRLLTGIPYQGTKNFKTLQMRNVQGKNQELTDLSKFSTSTERVYLVSEELDPTLKPDAEGRQRWNTMDILCKPCFKNGKLEKLEMTVKVNERVTFKGDVFGATTNNKSHQFNALEDGMYQIYLQSHHGSYVFFKGMKIFTGTDLGSQ